MLFSLFSLDRRNCGLLCGGLLGIFLVIQLILCAVMVLLRPEESILISGGILFPLACLTLAEVVQLNVSVHFQNGVRMSRTRRAMLGAALKLSALETALTAALCTALVFLERTVCIQLWALLAGRPGAVIMKNNPGGGHPWEPIFDTGVLRVEDFAFFSPETGLLIVLAGGVLGLVCGAFYLRFGTAGVFFTWIPFWAIVLWDIWLPESYAAVFSSIRFPLLAVLLAAGAVWSVRYLLRAPIRNS